MTKTRIRETAGPATKARRVLILGGTGEARSLATRLAGIQGLQIVTSLAGATRRPVRPPGEVRLGGFGGTMGLAAYLRDTRVDKVVDATHPYATVISAHAVAACAETGVPLLRLERPACALERVGDRPRDVRRHRHALRAGGGAHAPPSTSSLR